MYRIVWHWYLYNKLLYLGKRYLQLHAECISRGFNVQNYIKAWVNVPIELMNDYYPTKEDRKIVQERIKEKLNK